MLKYGPGRGRYSRAIKGHVLAGVKRSPLPATPDRSLTALTTPAVVKDGGGRHHDHKAGHSERIGAIADKHRSQSSTLPRGNIQCRPNDRLMMLNENVSGRTEPGTTEMPEPKTLILASVSVETKPVPEKPTSMVEEVVARDGTWIGPTIDEKVPMSPGFARAAQIRSRAA